VTFSVTTECNYRDGAFEVFLEFNRIQALLAAWNALLQPSSPVWAKKKSCHPENILFSGCPFERILLHTLRISTLKEEQYNPAPVRSPARVCLAEQKNHLLGYGVATQTMVRLPWKQVLS